MRLLAALGWIGLAALLVVGGFTLYGIASLYDEDAW